MLEPSEREVTKMDANATSTGDAATPSGAYCPVFQHVIESLGRRWTGVIVRELLSGPARFSDLKRAIPGLSDRLLVERLQELEHEHLVCRTVSEGPTYALTERGEDLRAAIAAVDQHASRWAQSCELAERPGRVAKV